MSNILATVGRNVQYVNKRGAVQAAIITAVEPTVAIITAVEPTVTLAVFDSTTGIYFVTDAKEYNAQAREVQVNVYKLNWQGR
jgi:hypothetical protein